MTDHPLIELTKARVREFLREPEALFWTFVFPILMALALGVAFRSGGSERVIVGVAEGDGAAPLVRALQASERIGARLVPASRIDIALRNGDVQLVVLPGTPPVFRYDPTRAESRLARVAVNDALQRASGRRDLWAPRDEPVVIQGSRYIDWLLPGLLGMNIMSTGLWSAGYSIVQARTRHLLKRLLATPMRRGHFLLSHLFGRLVFLGLEVGALLLFGWLAFRVPIRGSLVTLGEVAVLGALSFGGIGLLVASRARTVEGVSGLLNVVMMPMWLLSGVFFSSSNFPERVQPIIRALPLTALNEALRAVMMDGATAWQLGRQTLVLGAWGVAGFAIALRIFRWK